MVELSALLEESGYVCAPSPLLGTAGAALVISAAGSDEQRSEWLPKLASGEATGSFGGFADGQSTLFCDLPNADLVVTFDGEGALLALASEVDFDRFKAIDSTRSYGLESDAAVSHRIAGMLLATEESRSLTYYAAWTADAEPESLPMAAAMAGARAADAGWEVPASALQVLGGIGFTWEHDLHFWLKRGRVAGRMLGSPRDHRERVAELSGLGAGEPAVA